MTERSNEPAPPEQDSADGVLTVAALAEHKRLPPDFLEELGLRNTRQGVLIPYPTIENRLGRPHARRDLDARNGFRWSGPKEQTIVAYGASRLEEAKQLGYLIVVAGESDSWTLWHHGFPTLGLPGRGATMTKKIEEQYLDEIPRVVIIRERDEDAEAFVGGVTARLQKLNWQGEVSVLEMPEGIKDPSELYQKTGDAFKETFEELRAKAPVLDTVVTEPLQILDKAPASIARPLCLVGPHAYAASWIWINDPASGEARQALVILRDDGLLFSDEELEDARPLERLGMTVSLRETPQDSRIWSGSGVQRYLGGSDRRRGPSSSRCSTWSAGLSIFQVRLPINEPCASCWRATCASRTCWTPSVSSATYGRMAIGEAVRANSSSP